MHRAAEAPERFLTGSGFPRFLSQLFRDEREARKAPKSPPRKGNRTGAPASAPFATLPAELARFLGVLDGRSLGDFRPPTRLRADDFASLLKAATRAEPERARLVALLAGAVPFGETRAEGRALLCFAGEPPVRGLVATLHAGRSRRLRPTLVCRGIPAFALMCSLQAIDEPSDPASFGLAEEEAVRTLVDQAHALMALLLGTDSQLRAAARALAPRPLDLVLPVVKASRRASGRTGPLLLGPIVESFFRDRSADVASRLEAHATSGDRIVREAVTLFLAALGTGTANATSRDLARRRELALRAAPPAPAPSAADPMETTRLIVEHIDRLPPSAETYAARAERDEAFEALAELGDHGIAPSLVARALTGDATAVDMLAALGDRSLIPLVVPDGVPPALAGGVLGGERGRVRAYEQALVRMMVTLGARGGPAAALRRLLEENPLTGWREGLERGALVRELVIALGELADSEAAPALRAILESTSQEYRSILPVAAEALGRLHDVAAMPALERLLLSPKAAITCEALWAVGAIAGAHAAVGRTAAELLDRIKALEPGAEATKLVALTKTGAAKAPPRAEDLADAIERALFEPAYRQEDTARRRIWGFRALTELAELGRSGKGPSIDPDQLFFSRRPETVRYFVTRDDPSVRRAAGAALRAWDVPIPEVRKYWSFVLADVERQGGLDALLEAVRDAHGIYRHNVATRLAATGDRRVVRPLAEATARMFAEPQTSTYEYDDAPPQLVAFVRALARLNRPEGNDVLIEGLRGGHPQVRAVVAENAPEDDRFVPELMTMLGDPRSFLRSRAEKSLTTLGAIQPPILDPNSTEVAIVRRIVEV